MRNADGFAAREARQLRDEPKWRELFREFDRYKDKQEQYNYVRDELIELARDGSLCVSEIHAQKGPKADTANCYANASLFPCFIGCGDSYIEIH